MIRFRPLSHATPELLHLRHSHHAPFSRVFPFPLSQHDSSFSVHSQSDVDSTVSTACERMLSSCLLALNTLHDSSVTCAAIACAGLIGSRDPVTVRKLANSDRIMGACVRALEVSNTRSAAIQVVTSYLCMWCLSCACQCGKAFSEFANFD